MSRVASNPVAIPKGVETTVSDSEIAIKGSKGSLHLALHALVGVSEEGEELKISAKTKAAP